MIKSIIDPNVEIQKIPMNTDYKLQLDTDVIPNIASTIFLIGKPKSGKTNLMLNLLFGTKTTKFYNKMFDKVFFIGNIKTINSEKKIDLPEDQIFDTLSVSILEDIEEDIADSDMAVCLILDDMAAFLKQKGIKEKLRKMTFNRRHMTASGNGKRKPTGLWLIITSQKFNCIDKTIRQLGTHYALFKPNSADSISFFDEVLATSKDVWSNIQKFVFYPQPNHNFLWYDATSSQYYKNFNKIEFEEDEEEFDF